MISTTTWFLSPRLKSRLKLLPTGGKSPRKRSRSRRGHGTALSGIAIGLKQTTTGKIRSPTGKNTIRCPRKFNVGQIGRKRIQAGGNPQSQVRQKIRIGVQLNRGSPRKTGKPVGQQVLHGRVIGYDPQVHPGGRRSLLWNLGQTAVMIDVPAHLLERRRANPLWSHGLIAKMMAGVDQAVHGRGLATSR